MRINNVVGSISNASDKISLTNQPTITNHTNMVLFGVNYKPNQVLPETESLILRASKRINIEKRKILTALKKTWDSYALGRASNIYMGHREVPLNKYIVDDLNHQIQLTGNLPAKRRVYFSETEPNVYFIHVDPIKNTHHSTDIMYEVDFRTDKDGVISEFNPDPCEASAEPEQVEALNKRLQYCLEALFPKKKKK